MTPTGIGPSRQSLYRLQKSWASSSRSTKHRKEIKYLRDRVYQICLFRSKEIKYHKKAHQRRKTNHRKNTKRHNRITSSRPTNSTRVQIGNGTKRVSTTINKSTTITVCVFCPNGTGR